MEYSEWLEAERLRDPEGTPLVLGPGRCGGCGAESADLDRGYCGACLRAFFGMDRKDVADEATFAALTSNLDAEDRLTPEEVEEVVRRALDQATGTVLAQLRRL